MISDEAVEAATDAMQQFALTKDRDGLQAWDAYARAALQAAAPYMLAGVWDDREQAGAMNHTAEEYPEVKDITNPYRSQA